MRHIYCELVVLQGGDRRLLEFFTNCSTKSRFSIHNRSYSIQIHSATKFRAETLLSHTLLKSGIAALATGKFASPYGPGSSPSQSFIRVGSVKSLPKRIHVYHPALPPIVLCRAVRLYLIRIIQAHLTSIIQD